MPKLRLPEKIKAFFLHILELDRYWIMRITAVVGLIISIVLSFLLPPIPDSMYYIIDVLGYFGFYSILTYRILIRFTTHDRACKASLYGISTILVIFLIFLVSIKTDLVMDHAELILNITLRISFLGILHSILVFEYYLLAALRARKKIDTSN